MTRRGLAFNNVYKKKDPRNAYKPADNIKEQIQELMGSAANNEGDNSVDFTSKDVCRMYLHDCCPYGRFDGCKTDVPNMCFKIHDPSLRTDYLNRSSEFTFEVDAYLDLKNFIERQDFKIQEKNKSLEVQSEKIEIDERFKKEEIARTETLIGEIKSDLSRAEEAGNESQIAELTRKLDVFGSSQNKFRREINDLHAALDSLGEMMPCTICGGLVSQTMLDKRFNEHKLGKMHQGMVYLRQKLEELKTLALEKKNKWNNDSGLFAPEKHESHHYSPDRNRSASQESSRSYDSHSSYSSRSRRDSRSYSSRSYSSRSRSFYSRSSSGSSSRAPIPRRPSNQQNRPNQENSFDENRSMADLFNPAVDSFSEKVPTKPMPTAEPPKMVNEMQPISDKMSANPIEVVLSPVHGAQVEEVFHSLPSQNITKAQSNDEDSFSAKIANRANLVAKLIHTNNETLDSHSSSESPLDKDAPNCKVTSELAQKEPHKYLSNPITFNLTSNVEAINDYTYVPAVESAKNVQCNGFGITHAKQNTLHPQSEKNAPASGLCNQERIVPETQVMEKEALDNKIELKSDRKKYKSKPSKKVKPTTDKKAKKSKSESSKKRDTKKHATVEKPERLPKLSGADESKKKKATKSKKLTVTKSKSNLRSKKQQLGPKSKEESLPQTELVRVKNHKPSCRFYGKTAKVA